MNNQAASDGFLKRHAELRGPTPIENRLARFDEILELLRFVYRSPVR
jgi:hypothetical protein